MFIQTVAKQKIPYPMMLRPIGVTNSWAFHQGCRRAVRRDRAVQAQR